MYRVTLFEIAAGATVEECVLEMMATAEKTGWNSQAEINGRTVTVSPDDNLNKVMRRHNLLPTTCVLSVKVESPGLVHLRRNGKLSFGKDPRDVSCVQISVFPSDPNS